MGGEELNKIVFFSIFEIDFPLAIEPHNFIVVHNLLIYDESRAVFTRFKSGQLLATL